MKANVILISVDCLRADCLASINREGGITTNIDRLAEKGILFTKAFSTSSWTPPAFKSIMASQYPFSNNGYLHVRDSVTLPMVMKWLGYKTAAFHSNVINAKQGDSILVPPNYGHVTVNPSDEVLLIANLISARCKSEYDPYIKLRGAAVYLTQQGFVKNNSYDEVPDPRIVDPEPLPFLKQEKHIYDSFVRDPRTFKFLSKPRLLSGMEVYDINL